MFSVQETGCGTTKLKRRAATAVELIALCQTITADGRLADDEVAALKQWLIDNASVDLPAKDFLALKVAKILSDGVVTDDECDELYTAIEAALPRDIRGDVRSRRMSVANADREQRRAAREAARASAATARLNDTPMETWDFMVAGSLYEGRPAVIMEYARPRDLVYLARDPSNPYSANAIEVRLANGMVIGFVPETLARDIAPELDAGCPHSAYLKKILIGRRAPIPVVVASLYLPQPERPGVVLQQQVPAKTTVRRAADVEDYTIGARVDTTQLVPYVVLAVVIVLLAILWASR